MFAFIAVIYHSAIFHIAYRNPTFTNNFILELV